MSLQIAKLENGRSINSSTLPSYFVGELHTRCMDLTLLQSNLGWILA